MTVSEYHPLSAGVLSQNAALIWNKDISKYSICRQARRSKFAKGNAIQADVAPRNISRQNLLIMDDPLMVSTPARVEVLRELVAWQRSDGITIFFA